MHLRGLDLNLLVVLHTLPEEKNITRTARRIYLSQSATSGNLARLREFFEDDLLVQVGHQMVLTPLADSLLEPVRQLMAEAQAIIDQRPCFNAANSTRRFRMMMSDYVAAVLMPHALPIISREAPLVGIDILQFEGTPPEEVIDRVEVDMLILPQRHLSREHPYEELFRDTYTCIVWEGNRDVGDKLTVDQYFAMSHVAIRFTTQPADSLSEWILHHTGLTRRVDITARTYTVIPHLIVNTQRIATVHSNLASIYAHLLPIRIVEPPFEVPQIAESVQWHSFRNPDPGIAWMRKCLQEAAQGLKDSAKRTGALAVAH